jgi:hypothetical protein
MSTAAAITVVFRSWHVYYDYSGPNEFLLVYDIADEATAIAIRDSVRANFEAVLEYFRQVAYIETVTITGFVLPAVDNAPVTTLGISVPASGVTVYEVDWDGVDYFTAGSNYEVEITLSADLAEHPDGFYTGLAVEFAGVTIPYADITITVNSGQAQDTATIRVYFTTAEEPGDGLYDAVNTMTAFLAGANVLRADMNETAIRQAIEGGIAVAHPDVDVTVVGALSYGVTLGANGFVITVTVTVTLEYDGDDYTLTNVPVAVAMPVGGGGQPSDFVWGDTNGSGVIEPNDLFWLLRYLFVDQSHFNAPFEFVYETYGLDFPRTLGPHLIEIEYRTWMR